MGLQFIIAHQRLKLAEIPINEEVSAFHKQICNTADLIVSTRREGKREYYYQCLLTEITHYQEILMKYDALFKVTEPVKRLIELMRTSQRAFLN